LFIHPIYVEGHFAGKVHQVSLRGPWSSCTCDLGSKGIVCTHLVKAELYLHNTPSSALQARWGVGMGSFLAKGKDALDSQVSDLAINELLLRDHNCQKTPY